MTETIKHPEPCQACDDYYAYKDGLCWECYTEAQEVMAEEKVDRYLEEKHFGEGA